MRCLVLFLAFALACADAAAASPAPPGSFIVLCYHEVRKDVRDYPDPFAVDDRALVAQFAWLRGNGFTPVSLEQVIAARAGGTSLPAQAVLLTFDDAYLSFYTHVYPLLREFGYPAVLSVVGAWIDAPQGRVALYGEKGTVPDARFPTWAQLREMAASGLVEMASHSYDLHQGVLANPQGNMEPAATTRIYDPVSGTYESDSRWRARVQADLARNAEAIERGTGRRPRAIAWPYGSYNDELVRMARELGSPVTLTLEEGANTTGVPLEAVRRILVAHNPVLGDFVAEIRGPQFPSPLRAVEIALDDIYSAAASESESNLSALLDRIEALRPSHVYLKAYSGAPSQGMATPVYFPNRHLPVRADLFNRVAWQLRSRTQVKVFARMPESLPGLPPGVLAEVYEDLARHAAFDGLLFAESAAGTSGENAHALSTRAAAWRAPMGIARELGHTALDTRIVHEPAYAGEEGKDVLVLQSPQDGGAMYRRMRDLQLRGAIHFGYGPDDFRRNDPPLARTAPGMSLRSHPLQTAP